MQLSGCHQNTFHPFHCTRLLLAHSNKKLLQSGDAILHRPPGGLAVTRSRIWALGEAISKYLDCGLILSHFSLPVEQGTVKP
jgi:hypothetical protein